MDQAAKGAAALSANNYAEAIEHFTKAISINPNAVDYYIKRSTAYQRSSDYQAALKDAEIAVVLAVKRAKRELISQAQLRRAIALYFLERYGDANHVLAIVKRLDEKEKSLAVWEMKTQGKLKGLAEGDEKAKVTVKDTPDVEVPSAESLKNGGSDAAKETEKPKQQASAASAAAATAPAPAKEAVQTPPNKIKHDWYQNAENVYFTLLAKGIPKDKANIDIQERWISISFPTQTASTFDFSLDPLFAPIDPTKSTSNITPSKLELVLKKATPGKWSSLEGTTPAPGSLANPTATSSTSPGDPVKRAVLSNPSTTTTSRAPTYPTSSRTGPKDWDKLASDLTKPKDSTSKDGDWDLDDEGDEVNVFFKKLYAGADPDTRRAMVKSYQESNGTALSTNWAEVGKGKVETSPPDGMVAKRWGE